MEDYPVHAATQPPIKVKGPNGAVNRSIKPASLHDAVEKKIAGTSEHMHGENENERHRTAEQQSHESQPGQNGRPHR